MTHATSLNRRLLLAFLLLLCAMSAVASHQTSDPSAIYGTITGWEPATKRITLLDGLIVVDASKAYIVDKTGFPGTLPAVGLQAKIILAPGPHTGSALPAALVELMTRTPASMAGTVTAIDSASSTFVASGLTIRVTPETIWRGGANVRSIGELRVGHAVTAELVSSGTTSTATPTSNRRRATSSATADVLTATEVFVIGFLPASNHHTFGKVLSIDGRIWVVRDLDGKTHVFQTFDRTIFNSQGPVQAEARVGEYVSVTSNPDDAGVEIAYVITVMPPPSPQRGFGMAGTLLEVNESQKFLAIAAVPSRTREEFAITEETGFYLGAKVGDFVRVNADVPMVNGRAVALQVVKSSNTNRMGIQGTVQSINNGTWVIDGWTVLVSPQTILINNPRVGDVVRVVGESEIGSRTIRAESIERPFSLSE